MKDRKNSSAVNSAANLISRVWGIVSTYIFIPLYIENLGETSYGLVSFFATLQAAFTLLGLGLSSTLRREFAVGDKSYESRMQKHMIMRSVENIYALISLAIILICFWGAPFIANKWLNIEELDPNVVEHVIALMGISIGLQFLANLWFGCVLGLGRQVYANTCSLIWAVLKSVGSVIISMTLHDVALFYVWHIITDILYMFALRLFIYKALDIKQRWHIKDIANIKRIWRYALGLFVISIVALVTKEFDKALISKFLSLSELGAYNSATTLGNLAVIFASALAVSSLTDLTRVCTSGRQADTKKMFLTYNGLVSIVVITMGTFIAVFSSNIILFWTKNENYVALMSKAAPLVVLAITFIGLQEIPYSLVLANGNTKYNNIVGIASLPFIVILTYVEIKRNGILGAGVAYLLTMSLQTIVYLFIVYRKYMKECIGTLFFKNLFLPFSVSFLCAVLCKKFVMNANISNIGVVGIAVLAGGMALFAQLFTFGRAYLREFLKQRG